MSYTKTELGRRAMQTREIRLTPCQRAVLITVNGARQRAELEKAAASMGGGPADVDALVQLGLIEDSGTASDWDAEQESSGYASIAEPDLEIDSFDLQEQGAVAVVAPPPPPPPPPPAPRAATPAVLAKPVPAQEPKKSSAVSLDSLWPLPAPEKADAWDAKAIGAPEQPSSMQEVAMAKAVAQRLLEPLGLRTVQLRRTVEACKSGAQLREIEPLIREQLKKEQQTELDSVFFGLM